MSKYIPGQSQYQKTLDLYEGNLADIISEGVRSGADVIVGTLSYNRFYGKKKEDTTAPKFDVTPMNVVIKRVVEKYETRGENVYLAEVDWILASKSPLGRPDYTFFCDNIHFTFEGNYVLAEEWFNKVVEVLNSRGVVGIPKKVVPPPIEECARRLGWSEATELELVRLQKGVILDETSQGVLIEKERELTDKIGENVSEKVLATYALAYALNPDDEKIVKQYVDGLLKVGKRDLAMYVASTLYQKKPYQRISLRLLGNAYFSFGDLTNAKKFYNLCLRYYPDDGLAMESLKLIDKQGQ
jgi:tetratricopeptide (TPR) repeat protein